MGNGSFEGHSKDSKDNGRRGGKPRRGLAGRILVFLLLAVLALAAALVYKLYSLGFIENLPIVQKTGQGPAATVTPPPGLEPADGGDTGDQNEAVGPAEGKVPIYKREPIDPDVVNILVLGLDAREPGGNGRSDINMIVSVNKKKGTVKLASILRDTLVPIEGHDWNRLNSAYAFGGPGLSINTVNDAFDLDIQRYVKLDFYAIKDIINELGGVDVKLTQAEVTYLRAQGLSVSKGAGMKRLDGDAALAYSRIRKIDGDFQRTQRQRNVLTALLKEARGMGVVQAVGLMTKLLPQVKTNVSTAEAVSLAKYVLSMGGGETKQMAVPVLGSFEDKKYKGMSILSVDFKKNTDALREFLYGD
jgi:LCP family protein required for cell wall assembly